MIPESFFLTNFYNELLRSLLPLMVVEDFVMKVVIDLILVKFLQPADTVVIKIIWIIINMFWQLYGGKEISYSKSAKSMSGSDRSIRSIETSDLGGNHRGRNVNYQSFSVSHIRRRRAMLRFQNLVSLR
jgi:hypothetical protein